MIKLFVIRAFLYFIQRFFMKYNISIFCMLLSFASTQCADEAEHLPITFRLFITNKTSSESIRCRIEGINPEPPITDFILNSKTTITAVFQGKPTSIWATFTLESASDDTPTIYVPLDTHKFELITIHASVDSLGKLSTTGKEFCQRKKTLA